MDSVGDKLLDDAFFGDVVDTPKEGTEQHKKREELKSITDEGKLGHKWTHERVDRASDETINKTYAKYRKRELNENEREKLWGSMSLIYTLPEFLGWLKSEMFINYAKALRTIQSLKIKWLALAVFECVPLVVFLHLS